jgi:predicted MPP superfamily phosphohydrolase
VSLQFQNLPASFDGYRIALFSDVHIGTMLSPQKQCKKLVDIINATQPDAVAFCGDLINIRHTELTPRLVTTLRDIKARDGVYAVLGNHDRGVYVKDSVELSVEENTAYVVEHIHNCDWRLLRDSVAYVRRAEDSIAFVGIDFSDSLLVYKHSFETPSNLDTESIFANIPDSTFRITLSHLPQVWHLLRDRSHSDLTLAGHVHSSQIKFSCDNLQLSPAMIMYREWSGLYEEQGRTLYINDGIGVVGFFMRIGTRPEITLLELRK